MAFPKILFSRPNRYYKACNEYKASNFIPYYSYWNENTVITHDQRLMQVIKVRGFAFETADDEDLDIKQFIRNTLFKGMSSENLGLYFHVIRKKHPVYPESYSNSHIPSGFATLIDTKWVSKYKDKEAFKNDLYITLIYKSNKRGALDKLIAKIRSENQDALVYQLMAAYEQLEDASKRVLNSLKEYDVDLLGIKETEDGYYSEIAEFFSTIVNVCSSSRMLYSLDDINNSVINSRLYFKSRYIKVLRCNGETEYAGIVSIKEYPSRTWPGILDNFLKLPFEFVITQSFTFSDRQSSIHKMQLQQNRMVQSGDKALSQIDEITYALDKAMSGEIGFGMHHCTVMCVAKNIKELDNNLSIAAVELTNLGGIGARESQNMETAFWAQMPGNFEYVARKSTINTLNLASFNSLHNYLSGKAKGNFWGDAVTVLDTTSGTPYYFNFHVRDVGHTMIVGPTGSGKTVLLNFLCAQAQKFQCRLFFFDKDRGAEIFLRALGGNYTTIRPSERCGFNPLQLPDTGENRTFLLEWLKQLVTANGESISAAELDLLYTAINGNYRLLQQDRKLSNIAPFLGTGGAGSIAGRLSMWHGDGSHAKVFDNNVDLVDFSKSSIFGFEMADLLKDKITLGPVLNYIFHRINISLTGFPTMIVLDEAWALIDNPVFAPRLKDWLKVLRKLNTFVVFATQSVEDATKSSISDTLVQQTATQIFLPNLKATETYMDVFMLTEREYFLVRTTDPSSRYFLVKQGNDSVMIRVDLSEMPDIISVLSGRADTVVILDEVINNFGNNPENWLPEFVKRVKNV